MMSLRTFVCVAIVAGTSLSLLTLKLQAGDSTSFEAHAQPFLAKYCVACHGFGTQEGDVALHELTGVDAGNDQLWKSILEQVAVKEMPPRGEEQPTLKERQQLVDFICI